jgi:hypothetical protein
MPVHSGLDAIEEIRRLEQVNNVGLPKKKAPSTLSFEQPERSGIPMVQDDRTVKGKELFKTLPSSLHGPLARYPVIETTR